MRIALLENQSIGVNIHRLLTPYKHLQSSHEVIMTNGVVNTDYDVIVFNRLPNQCLTDLEFLKKKTEVKSHIHLHNHFRNVVISQNLLNLILDSKSDNIYKLCQKK